MTKSQPSTNKIFLSRIHASFDEHSVKRLLEETLGIDAVVSVQLAYVQDEAVKKQADETSEKNIKTAAKHSGYGFVVLKSPKLAAEATALQTIRGTAKETSTKKHSFYIGRVAAESEGSQQNCFLWTQHRCPYGVDCKFAHDGPGGILATTTERAKLKKCRDYSKGKCRKGNDCLFSHDFIVASKAELSAKADSEKDCLNWKTKGKCRKLDSCPYKHEEAMRGIKKRKLDAIKNETTKASKKRQPLWARVYGLSYDTTEDAVRMLFRDCGPIKQLEWPVFQDSGRSKGYCGVLFESPTAVEKAVALNGHELDGRWLSIQAGKMYLDQ
jgi:hypothetical protein